MRHLFRYLLAPALALSASLWPTAVLAEFHTYQIEEIFSNADGTVQYVVMHESQGMSGEYFWAGNPFISSHAGQSKLFTFPNNLPVGMNCNPYTGCAKAMPTSTANTRVADRNSGICRSADRRAGLRDSQRVPFHRGRDHQLCRRRSGDLQRITDRRRHRHQSQRHDDSQCRDQFVRSDGFRDARRDQLPGPLVQIACGVGVRLGHQFGASGRRHIRHVVHL